MGSMSITHWLIVALVVVLLFGRGRISETMGDFGKGLRSFKKGLADDDAPAALNTKQESLPEKTTTSDKA